MGGKIGGILVVWKLIIYSHFSVWDINFPSNRYNDDISRKVASVECDIMFLLSITRRKS